MRILVNISYQGSQFLGFQIQQQGRTVQQQFEKILKRMHRRHVRIHPLVVQTEVYMRMNNFFILIQT